jgi:hypothetical protein
MATMEHQQQWQSQQQSSNSDGDHNNEANNKQLILTQHSKHIQSTVIY